MVTSPQQTEKRQKQRPAITLNAWPQGSTFPTPPSTSKGSTASLKLHHQLGTKGSNTGASESLGEPIGGVTLKPPQSK